MSILLTKPVRVAGTELAAGTPQTFGKDIEADLVTRKFATYTTDPRDNAETPVMASTNITGESEFQKAFSNLPGKIPADVDIMFYRPVGREYKFALPNPYLGVGDNAITHPCPCYVPEGMAGYKYWLSFTPLPNNDSAYENPCVVASNSPCSGYVVPPGTVNPLNTVISPAYNRDAHIYFDGANNKIILVWNTFGEPTGKTKLKIREYDGATWSPVYIIYEGTTGSTDIVSPSIWFNDVSGKWEIVGVYSDTANRELVKITSSNLYSGWDTSATLLTVVNPGTRKPWHLWLTRLKSGRVIGLLQDDVIAAASGYVNVIQSSDGVIYDYYPVKTDADSGRVTGGKWYRSGAFLIERNGSVEMTAIMGMIGNPNLIAQKFKQIDFNIGSTEALKRKRDAVLSSASPSQCGFLALDNFNRADLTDAGTMDSGAVWTQIVPANPIGIIGNTAYNSNSNGCVATVGVSSVAYSVSVTLDTIGTEGYLVVNRQDSTHFWRIGSVLGILLIQRFNGTKDIDVFGSDGPLKPVIANGSILRADVSSRSIKFSVNGMVVYETDAGFANSPTVGLQASGAVVTKFDAFSVEPL